MSIQRRDWGYDCLAMSEGIIENKNGQYVLYKDHLKEVSLLKEEIDSLKNKIERLEFPEESD